MVHKGFEKSPIQPATLHTRLKAKGIIRGEISTLTSRRNKPNPNQKCQAWGITLKLFVIFLIPPSVNSSFLRFHNAHPSSMQMGYFGANLDQPSYCELYYLEY